MDKPVTETLRFARLLWLERQEFSRKDAFWGQTSDKVLRYQSAINCQLTKAIDQLEDIQAERKAASGAPGTSGCTEPIGVADEHGEILEEAAPSDEEQFAPAMPTDGLAD